MGVSRAMFGIRETFGVDSPLGFSNTFQSAPSDFNGIDWMAAQNGGLFDPVLFGDYRDPQDNILNNFDDFFNDALPTQDFASPYNAGEAWQQEPKRDLMKELEVKQNGGNEDREEPNRVGFTELWSVFLVLFVAYVY